MDVPTAYAGTASSAESPIAAHARRPTAGDAARAHRRPEDARRLACIGLPSTIDCISSQSIATLILLSTVALRRRLIALLVACALILPFLGGLLQLDSAHSAPLSQASATHALAAHEDPAQVQHLAAGDALPEQCAENDDAYADNHAHEVDKLLSLFSLRWDQQATSATGIFLVASTIDPVFPFERPPKTPLA
jgi:hypothetical protein